MRALILYFLLAWIGPIFFILIGYFAGPNPNASRQDFLNDSFQPELIWVEEQKTDGADYFELRLKHEQGKVYFHRNPERPPIDELADQVPRNQVLNIIYREAKFEGNELLEIVVKSSGHKVLSFDDVMAEYALRQNIIIWTSIIWAAIVNLVAFLLWKVIPIEDTRESKSQ